MLCVKLMGKVSNIVESSLSSLMAGRSDDLQRCKLLTWHKAKPYPQTKSGWTLQNQKQIYTAIYNGLHREYQRVRVQGMCCCVAICALRTGESRKNAGLGHRTTVGDAAASFADLSPSFTALVCHLQRKALHL